MKRKLSFLHILGLAALAVIVAPIIYLLLQVFQPSEWALKPRLLSLYVKNTLIMVLITGSIASFLGVSLAFIVSFYDFPLRRLLRVLLALPLAIPPYIAAHAYAEFSYYGGLLHKALKNLGINAYLDMQNFAGAIFIYIITLYPYVYLMCLSFFKQSSASLIDNARVLGARPAKLFFKVGLPMARLPIVAGATLAIMELVSDFGVVDYFGVQAFSTGIYKTWLNYDDFTGAIRLSSIFLIVILLLILTEAGLRRRLKYFTSSKSKPVKEIQTEKKGRAFIYGYLSLVLLFCFALPVLQLLYDAFLAYKDVMNYDLLRVIGSSFLYSSISALVCVAVSFTIAHLTKSGRGTYTAFVTRLATMGYSVPGVIIGLAVIFSFIDVDKLLLPLYRAMGLQKKLVLSTSLFVLLFAYVVRFLAVSYNNIYAGYKKINPNLFRASHTLGKNSTATFFKVDLPLMMPSLLTSFLLVFLEIIKELPITLMLKPYNVETLTGRIHNYVHNEQIAEAAIPSLIIILLGVIAVTLTMLYREKKHVKT